MAGRWWAEPVGALGIQVRTVARQGIANTIEMRLQGEHVEPAAFRRAGRQREYEASDR